MKTKQTNMLRGKERKNRYAKLNRGKWKIIYIHKRLTARGKEQ